MTVQHSIAVACLAAAACSASESFGLLGYTRDGWIYDVGWTSSPTNPRSTGISHLIGVATTPDGRAFGLSSLDASVYEIDPLTGHSRFIADNPSGDPSFAGGDLVYDAQSGLLYGTSVVGPTGTFYMFTIDPDTGDIGGYSFEDTISYSALAIVDRTLYSLNRDSLVKWNIDTGLPIEYISLSRTLGMPTAMEALSSGNLNVYDASTGNVYRLSPSTGRLSRFQNWGTSPQLDGVRSIPSAPTIATLALGALALRTRRGRVSAARA